MKFFQNQKNYVYDNMYSKPPQLGDEYNAKYSVEVHFYVKETALKLLSEEPCGNLIGQYNFVECERSVIPGTNNIPDKDVEYWWHISEYDDICKQQPNSSILRNTKART